ncbi:MAG: FtsQ-type POTRA domain-containing protein [Smithellaceae bacterium]
MPKKTRTSIIARKNRLRRRMADTLGEFLRALGLLLSAVVLCCLFIYAYGYLLSTPYFEIKEISVRGLKELTEQDVLTQAAMTPRQNLLSVNVDALAGRISANPWVKNIHVGRELPNRMVLEIKERNPVALVKQSNGLYLMDNEGNVFKKLDKNDEVDLPILTGVDVKEKEKSRLLLSTLNLLQTMSASNRYSYLGTIAEVNVKDVVGVSLLTDTGLYLKLGTDNYEKKLNTLSVVMADLEKRGMRRGYLFVDICDATKITIQYRDVSERPEQEKKGKEYRT